MAKKTPSELVKERLALAASEAAKGNTQAAANYAQAAANIKGTGQEKVQTVANQYFELAKTTPTSTPPAPSSPVNITPKPISDPGFSSSVSTTASSPPIPPPPTPPSPWLTVPTYTRPLGIKQADPDIVIDPEIDTTGDYIAERFFEELGGTELISLSRHDLIDGIDVSYKPIANLSSLRRRFNPNNIIALDILSDNEFSKFNINLLSRGMNEPYFDDSGNLVVEIDIIRPQENIEVEISLSGTVTRIEL
jgi:hypothetical protein